MCFSIACPDKYSQKFNWLGFSFCSRNISFCLFSTKYFLCTDGRRKSVRNLSSVCSHKPSKTFEFRALKSPPDVNAPDMKNPRCQLRCLRFRFLREKKEEHFLPLLLGGSIVKIYLHKHSFPWVLKLQRENLGGCCIFLERKYCDFLDFFHPDRMLGTKQHRTTIGMGNNRAIMRGVKDAGHVCGGSFDVIVSIPIMSLILGAKMPCFNRNLIGGYL